MVDYVVTEYGAVKISSSPTWMRAEKMINTLIETSRSNWIKS